jgi:hypothetical protein
MDETSLILGQERPILDYYRLHSGTVPVSGVRKNVLYNLRMVHIIEEHQKYSKVHFTRGRMGWEYFSVFLHRHF